MRRFNAHVFHDVMCAYVQYEDAADGELVDAEEALAELAAAERRERIARDVIDSWVTRDIRYDVLIEIDRRIADREEWP